MSHLFNIPDSILLEFPKNKKQYLVEDSHYWFENYLCKNTSYNLLNHPFTNHSLYAAIDEMKNLGIMVKNKGIYNDTRSCVYTVNKKRFKRYIKQNINRLKR